MLRKYWITVAALLLSSMVLSTTPALAVRVNNLPDVEATANVIANTIAVSHGLPILLLGIVLLFLPDRRKLGVLLLPVGVVALLFALALPTVINMIVAPQVETDTY